MLTKFYADEILCLRNFMADEILWLTKFYAYEILWLTKIYAYDVLITFMKRKSTSYSSLNSHSHSPS